MHIGKSVAILLVKRNITKGELREALDVDKNTISNLIKNDTCSGPMLKKLYEFFDIKASDLIKEGEE